jgi:dienelactone hydrolase
MAIQPHASRCAALLLLMLMGPTAAPVARAQVVDVTSWKPDPITGAPRVRLTGFPANTEVEVSFIRTPPDGLPPSFRATARYRTGADGSVDVATAPVSGDWQAAAPEAPFYSMRPDSSAPVPSRTVVLIQATAQGIRAQAEYRLPEPVPVQVEEMTQFPGAFLVRPTSASGPLPLIIVLGGSEGDDRTAREVGPHLAAEGYAVLGFPYYSPDRGRGQAIAGLPSVFSAIPVDRLEEVHRWASTDPRIDANRIGLWGQSKGGEFAIIAAANYPWLDAVAAIVPSDVVWEGFGSGTLERTGTSSFSLGGKPLPFVRYGVPGRARDSKDTGRAQYPQDVAAALIPIERFRGLLLVAGGEQDRTWNSAAMSQSITQRRTEHGLPTVSLIFPDAGHGLVGSSLEPAEVSRGGGTVAGNSAARKAVWAATLELFRTAWPAQHE